MTVRIGNAAGFLGDCIDAPRLLVEAEQLDYLTLEYLAELTMSILARSRQKDPEAGYAADFLDVLRSLCPALFLQTPLKIVTNAGGVHPRACAVAAGRILSENGSGQLTIGMVTGDDILDRLEELMAEGCDLKHLETGQPFRELKRPTVSAHVYLGAEPIVEALVEGSRLVVTGRVADVSLTVGPAMHEFGWTWDDWDRLAGASVAGHLIECGAQVTGGYSTAWEGADLATVGYPIAELGEDGEATITKPAGSGGAVTRMSVVEQLLYEIGDPARYMTPDVEVDFTTVDVADEGSDRVLVRGATGRPASASYKVSLAFHAGYTASGQLLVYGRDCLAKAKAAAEIVFERVRRAGFDLDETSVELLGTGDGVPGVGPACASAHEVVLRMAARDHRREAVERFTREVAPLVTSGPAGLAGYASGRNRSRPVFAYWPALLPKEWIEPRVELRTADEWTRF